MSVTNTHAPVVLQQTSERTRRDGDPHYRSSASKRSTIVETLQDVVPLILFVPAAGPPAILLVGPLLLLVLLLIPPAAVLITLAVVFLLGAALLAALGALIASPYLLVRHLRARHPIARRAPDVSEAAAPDGGRLAKRSIRPRLIHLTTR